MSSFDVSSPNATSALRNLPQDGHKNLNVVSLKMLEIAEKLESLNQQCHILEVENKGKYSVFFKEADSSNNRRLQNNNHLQTRYLFVFCAC